MFQWTNRNRWQLNYSNGPSTAVEVYLYYEKITSNKTPYKLESDGILMWGIFQILNISFLS